jgi:hypothetical protein
MSTGSQQRKKEKVMLKYIRMIELTRKMDETHVHGTAMHAETLKEFQKEIAAQNMGHLFIEALRVRYGKRAWHDESHAKLGGVKK